MNFTVNNQENFQTTSALHSINTRNRHDLHGPAANLHAFRKMHCILASKSATIYDVVSSLTNKKVQFKAALKRYLNTHFFSLFMNY
jgi:hypothetical protein